MRMQLIDKQTILGILLAGTSILFLCGEYQLLRLRSLVSMGNSREAEEEDVVEESDLEFAYPGQKPFISRFSL